MLTLSFLINIILLAAVFYLFKEIQALKENQPTHITAVFEKYLEEIREENDRLQANLSSSPIQMPTKKPHRHQDILQKEVKTQSDLKSKSEVDSSFMPESVQAKDIAETSHQARILQMYEKGLTSEEISRSLNCGHTEVELTLKLYRKSSY